MVGKGRKLGVSVWVSGCEVEVECIGLEMMKD